MKGAGTVNRFPSDGQIRDYGPEPLVVNIDRFAKLNPNYRTAKKKPDWNTENG